MAAPQKAYKESYDQPEDYGSAAKDSNYTSKPELKVMQTNEKKTATHRFTTGDRSAQIQELNKARNVRTSTMPGAPRNQQFDSSRPDIATEFNQSYAKQGIQPSSLDDTPARTPYQPARPVSRTQVEYSSQPVVALPRQKNKLKIKGGKLATAKGALARGRVTTLNAWIWSAGFLTWWFQLIFGILSLVFLGLAVAIESFISKLNPTEDDGFITKAIKGTAQFFLDGFSWFVDKVLGVFKIDISILNPTNLFLMTYMVVLAYGIFILFAIYLIYKISLLNPLSGKGAGMKKGAFLLALVGYSIPILNIFPWFIFWTMTVWRHPK